MASRSPLTKDDLLKALKAQTKELKTYTDKQTEALAIIVNTAFEEQRHSFDKVEERLAVVETKLDKALYIETAFLEARLTRLEQHVGLKPPKTPSVHKT